MPLRIKRREALAQLGDHDPGDFHRKCLAIPYEIQKIGKFMLLILYVQLHHREEWLDQENSKQGNSAA